MRPCLFHPDCECDDDCGCRGDLEGLLARAAQIGDSEIERASSEHIVKLVRDFYASGNMDMAILSAVALGERIMFEKLFDDWERGGFAWFHGQKAAKATWGPEEDRSKKRDDIRRMFNEVRSGVATNEAAFSAIAKRTGIAKRTVRRMVTGH